MWGSGVADLNTIPAHFNDLHPEYRAYNHGEAGFVSRQGLAKVGEFSQCQFSNGCGRVL